jgi:hypothetical protein
MNHKRASHDGMKMPGWMKAWIYSAASICLASGAMWLVLHNFVSREGDFGPEQHPLERVMLVGHGCVSLLLVWLLGVIFIIHVKRGWQKKQNRTAGLIISLISLLLMLSGMGLYYLGSEQLRMNTATLHWVLGLLAGLALPMHIYWGRALQARKVKSTAAH